MTSLRTFLEDQGFYRIPLIRLTTGHYKLKAKVNGAAGEFVLDTGASTSCIGLINSDYFYLVSQESEVKAAGAGATNMHTKVSGKNTFSIGSWETKNMDFRIVRFVTCQ